MTKLKLPNRFHIKQIVFNVREGIHSFEITFEVRELMKLYRILTKRNETRESEKIKKFLNSYALCCNINDFNINERISIKKIDISE